MAERTIRFRIRPDGRVEETVEGVAGSLCQQLTERIESRLGVVQQRRQTSEAYLQAQDVSRAQNLSQDQTLSQAQTVSQGFSTL